MAGIITIHLPDGIRTGLHWTVDVLQIRGSTQKVLGGFQVRFSSLSLLIRRAFNLHLRRLFTLILQFFFMFPFSLITVRR